MKKNFFIPGRVDIIITVLVLVLMVAKNGSNVYNDAYWVTLIYFVAWGSTNLIKYSNQYIDKKNEPKRRKYKRRHIDNPLSSYKEYPQNLKEIDSNYHYDDGFSAMKLLFGMIAVVGVAIYNSVVTQFGNDQLATSAVFKDFSVCFLVDAFLIPLILMFIQAFSYNNTFLSALKEYVHSAFTGSKGKVNILRGCIIFLASIFLVGFATHILSEEFYVKDGNCWVKGIYIIMGVFYTVYSIWSSIHTNCKSSKRKRTSKKEKTSKKE